jgi:hypothetical protein
VVQARLHVRDPQGSDVELERIERPTRRDRSHRERLIAAGRFQNACDAIPCLEECRELVDCERIVAERAL